MEPTDPGVPCRVEREGEGGTIDLTSSNVLSESFLLLIAFTPGI